MFKIREKKMKKISKSKLRLLKSIFLKTQRYQWLFFLAPRLKGQALFDSDVDIAVYF